MAAFIELCAGMVSLSVILSGRKAPIVIYRGGKTRLAREIFEIGDISPSQISGLIWCEANSHTRRFLRLWSDPHITSAAIKILAEWVYEGVEAMIGRWWRLKKIFETSPSYDVTDEEFAASFFMWRALEGHLGIVAAFRLGADLEGSSACSYPRDWIVVKAMNSAKAFQGVVPDALLADAGAIAPFSDAIVYIDPPYKGTLGYSESDLSRERLVEIARSWHAAGAKVLISEAEEIPDLIADGWHSARCPDRIGFNPKKPAQEWVTINRQPYGELGRDGILSLFRDGA